ncbi:MAG: hypothetical protein ABGX04_01580 [Myxococcales bacterium]|nr:hypothetical protein [Myxococcales bacterium]HIK83797.1 hypothetical protein [Myxococcales bacterium]
MTMNDQPSPDLPRRPQGFWWASSAGLAALAVTLQMRFFDRTAIPMDEGQLAAAAVRILNGEVLYRDIHTGIGPGIYHVTAALFAFFGRDLLVTRWAQVGVNAAIAICLWLLAARVVRLHWAALAPLGFLLLIVVSFPVLTMLNYSSLALATAIGALLVLQRYLESGRRSEGILLGVLLAVTALTKQNYGALTIVAIGAAIAWNRPNSALAGRSLLAGLLPIVGSGAALALIMAAYFGAQGALGDLIDATLIHLGGAQLQAFNNPIPAIFGTLPSSEPLFIFLYTPPTLFNHLMHGGTLFDQPITLFMREMATRISYGIPLFTLAITPAILWITRRQRAPRPRREAQNIALFSLFFFLGIFPSAIWSHLAFVVAPTLLGLAILLDSLESVARRRYENTRWVALVGGSVILAGCLIASIRIGDTIQGWYPRPLELPRATLFVTKHHAALYRGAIDFIEECAGPDESIFVAPDIPIVYFLTGRLNPTPYELTIPGNVDEHVIIERLDRAQTRCIVYNPRMYPEFPPFEELFPALSRYLNDTYRQSEIIAGVGGNWHGLVRREPAAP